MFAGKTTIQKVPSTVPPESREADTPSIQRKLKVGSVNDPMEEEADNTADRVMRMPEGFVQRKCAECEKEEQLQRKDDGGSVPSVSAAMDHAIRNSSGRGSAMDGATQSFMSSRMGRDFSHVNIHSDGEAVQMNRKLSARAFTVGRDIYFNEGEYQPDSHKGRHLLAHELTHTIQQGGSTRAVQRQEDPDKKDPDKQALLEALERRDTPIFLSRLRALSADESDSLLADPQFWTQIKTVFHASALWSVFTILFFKGKMSQPQRRLGVALFSKNIDDAMDALAIILTQEPMPNKQYWDTLEEVVLATFETDPKLQDFFRLILIAENSVSGGPSKLSFAQHEVHYDTAPGAGVSLRSFGGSSSSVVYTTTSEFRVVVTIRLVDGNDPKHPNDPSNQQPYSFSGNASGNPDKWADAIRKVWNNRFVLNNGINRLRFTVSPVFTSEAVPADKLVSIFQPGQKCPGVAEANRENAGCWFPNTKADTASHEFGHLLGAGDEYNLPKTTADIPANQLAGLSPTERSLTTLSGLQGLPKNLGDVNTTSCDSPSQGKCIEGQMGYHNDSTEVKGRHILLLINAFNASQPPGTPPYSISPL